MITNRKILIIGSGIAGISVAYHLIKEGVKVTLIDNQQNDSSAVAGALITPIVFRRMNKSWRVDEFIHYLKEFYPKFNQYIQGEILSDLSLRRMFSSDQEREFWIERQSLPDYKAYLETVTDEDLTFDLVKNEFGSGRLKNTLIVNTALLMQAAQQLISEKGTYICGEFDYNRLNGRVYIDVEYDHIVFCEGHKVSNNPWFNYLPINKTKGELLTVIAKSLPEHLSINRKCFMLPLGNHHFKVGSTYSWNDDSTNPTVSGKNEILKKLSVLIDEEVKVVDHIAGVRPTSKDRRPFMGEHPEIPSYFVFNGLGTKGFLLAPLLSKEFVDNLIHGVELHPEVSLTRIIK